MDNIQKMLQAILNGQNALKQELVSMINKVDLKVGKLAQKLDYVDKKLTDRIDKIGRQLTYLEDDTPTREEFDNLEKRVDKMSEAPASQ